MDAQECANPLCSAQPSRSYTDDHDNVLDVCSECYWELVTGNTSSPTIEAGDMDEEIPPGTIIEIPAPRGAEPAQKAK